VFCKPLSASNGLYAEVIESEAAFADYMRASRASISPFSFSLRSRR
jgi:hypothetical protein